MIISRRKLIGGTVLVTGTAALSGSWLFAKITNPKGVISEFIARHVPPLSANDEAVVTFAEHAVPIMERRWGNKFDAYLILLDNPSLIKMLTDEQGYRQSQSDRTLITMFLKSTDVLVTNGSGEKVKYLSMFDPYRSGCSNQLAEFS